jgi:hypothetical protein
MAALRNSKRRLLTATYVPIRRNSGGDDIIAVSRVQHTVRKMSYIRSLEFRADESRILRDELQATISVVDRNRLLAYVDWLDQLASDTSGAMTLRNLKAVGKAPKEDLIVIGRVLARVRAKRKVQLQDLLLTLRERFQARVSSTETPTISVGPSAAFAAGGANTGETITPPVSPSFRNLTKVKSNEVFEWAIQHEPELSARIRSLTQTRVFRGNRIWLDLESDEIATLPEDTVATDEQVPTDEIVDAFEESIAVDPVGRLHLERIEMFPVGIERGELLYTLPLAPGETVNVIEKEWSVRNEEFETIVSDSFEAFSEEGVSEKNDLAKSTDNQSVRDTAFSLSGSYSYLGASAAIGYNSSTKDEHAEKESRNHAIDVTRKASSRSKKDHKYSLKVLEVAGQDRTSGRLVVNPSANIVRLEYYQLVRKWQVDLYRYGIRMTYDIVIPAPGTDLLAKVKEIDRIERELGRPFEFTQTLSGINRENWDSLAALHGTVVDPPPAEYMDFEVSKLYTEDTRNFFDSLEFSVPANYRVLRITFFGRFDPDNEDNEEATIYLDVMDDNRGPRRFSDADSEEEGRLSVSSAIDRYDGKSGTFVVPYVGQNLREGVARLTVRAQLRGSAFQRWRLGVWDVMKEAAENNFLQARERMQQTLAKLREELGVTDALTLRKMEREEIMKGILRWLFGPGFQIAPTDISSILDSVDENTLAALSSDDWQRVLNYGEFIKFVHQAIEWENVAYFVYPYFWSSKDRELRRWLKHPDFRHRDFLRGGATRVVLTIRPGFEEDFVRFVETGEFGGELDPQHPYLTIAQEIRNFATTNYPGIPPANPESDNTDEVDTDEQGVLVARWFEFTPSSGVDLTMNQPTDSLA